MTLRNILTLVASMAAGSGQDLSADVRVTEILPIRNEVPARLCPGSNNAVRVGIAWTGAIPERPIRVSLTLAMPDNPLGGILVAEGSVTPHSAASATTFTFLNVQVSERMRGRAARLVARVVADRAMHESDTTNNVRHLEVDATDWTCH
ncbi:MAG: hypothetical protein ABJE10_21615 [bacterium]